MLTMDALRDFGANVEEGLSRCVGNEGLYLRLARTILTDGSFEKLQEAVQAGNLQDAYETAHALKGVTANLALTPLSEPVGAFSDILKDRVHQGETQLPEDADERLQHILQVRARLQELAGE